MCNWGKESAERDQLMYKTVCRASPVNKLGTEDSLSFAIDGLHIHSEVVNKSLNQ